MFLHLNSWRQLVSPLASSPTLFQWFNAQRALEMEALEPMLDEVFTTVQSHLETVRQSFPRFYFVDDRTLLPCLGPQVELSDILVALRQCSAWSSLEFDGPKQLAAVLAGGERLALAHSIHLPGPLPSWVESAMKAVASALQLQKHLALTSLRSDDPIALAGPIAPPKRARHPRSMGRPDSRLQTPATSSAASDICQDTLLSWARTYPAQALLLAIRIHATQQIDDILAGPRQDRRHGLKQLLQTFGQRRVRVQALQAVDQGLSPHIRSHLLTVAAALHETELLLDQLNTSKVLRADDALWVLAPKWRHDTETQEYTVQLGYNTRVLGDEYYGGAITLEPWIGKSHSIALQLSTLGQVAAHSVAYGVTSAVQIVRAWNQSCGWYVQINLPRPTHVADACKL